MGSSGLGGDSALSLRWVEVTDAAGHPRLEMRWADSGVAAAPLPAGRADEGTPAAAPAASHAA